MLKERLLEIEERLERRLSPLPGESDETSWLRRAIGWLFALPMMLVSTVFFLGLFAVAAATFPLVALAAWLSGTPNVRAYSRFLVEGARTVARDIWCSVDEQSGATPS